ncbi:hypothetical protein CHS0354_010898 [Potamilus streckersoni]|uniref:Leucine-rich repeat-containing protein n=1 Tax=Potamilus streckersoni TaxID=2493646 RepID=A0AAE0VYF3_9BIVA|nr:hypothetical protein CHS0354_010898 [Potamilus streckersoni]
MSAQLREDFVERRCHPIPSIPQSWQLENRGQYMELDLKMCQLKSIQYAFKWGKESGPLPRLASIIETPSRIVRLDLSLNELTALENENLIPFKKLRDLNASLNRINKFSGIEVLKHLCSLNVSHNFIKKIDNLVPLPSLVELNLSMNELIDISYMPSLINLEILNINNNKIRSLDGVQSLPRLRELQAQRNELEDVVPLTSCFHLQILNVADNHITTLHNTVDILGQLKRLEVLNLHGNPIERDRQYRTEILQHTNVMTLDNVSIRPLPKKPDVDMTYSFNEPSYKHVHNIHTLQDAAKQAFEERMREAKVKMEDQISFMQRRIIELQNEYADYEFKLKTDLESCLRYLDSLSAAELNGVSSHTIRDTMGTPGPKPWTHRPKKDDKPDYSHVKQTDQVLKLASLELTRDTQDMY